MKDLQASAWEVCERVAEAQALLHDHVEDKKHTATEVVARLDALFKENGLLRAMWEVGYFPPDTPPPVVKAPN